MTLRKLTTLLLLLLQAVKGHRPSLLSSLGVLFIVIGALVAGSFDATVSLYSLVLVLVEDVCTAARYELVHLLVDEKTSPMQLTVQTYLVCLPVAALAALCCESPGTLNSAGIMGNLGSALCAILSTIAVNLCAAYTSPLATSVTGNMKDILSVAVGLLVFQEGRITSGFVTGLLLSVLGACVYSYASIRALMAKEKTKVE